ncbi:Stress response protein nst1 [Colletotrichum trifolii]|uniref:Stress response protein NST1 n=1 Tax=Colletotrichum trifolii TaxID=5466 RepID=A0A4R8RTI4_COLTR|nr:Stress response protein nst1 [Colletotrichum trifolii]
MPANHRQAASQTPASPDNKATARYTNKDGSKIITVPKGPPSAEPSLPSTPTSSANDPNPNAGVANGVESQQPAINRKKQKRRAKAAAKAAAEQAAVQTPNGRPSLAPADPAPSFLPTHDDPDQDFSDDDHDDHRSLDDGLEANGVAGAKPKKSKKKKKKKGKNSQQLVHAQFDGMPHSHSHSHSHPHSPLPSAGHAMSKDKIWNTSSNQERLRIKEFWLNLGEDERKSLVKVEKDAVLRKMKEQQKHTCSCTVCGRKRTAIEEELEGLYDAYYMELESFAHHSESPPLLGTPHHADFPLRPSQLPLGYERRPPSHSAEIVHHNGDDEEDDEDPEVDYSEDDDDEDLEDDDEYSDEGLDDPEEVQPDDRDVADFLTFGNSLQVKGGILTVADDLLKNDGRRFIEMMEQLAERRMAREEDAREGFSRPYGHPPDGSYSSHDPHPPQDDDYDDDEEDDEDEYDSQDDEFEEEEDTMTEKQRMEEGRRMFQIFAARMFEQRVLAAYRDMVAKQRQQQLIAEIDEESRQDEQRKAKKAKENQKRKDKAALKKQQAAEDKARREAEKAAEEAARREEQRRKTEEQRLRAEEKRRKKEEQKRHEEEERLRKEAERLRRLQEQQEKRAEQERKARESREKAQKLKEEARQREKEAREQREREARDRKEKQEQAKRDKEQKAKAEKDNRERLKQEDKAAQKAAAMAAAPIPIPNQGRRPSQHPVPVPTHPPNPASFASPKIPVATPTISKAPTPIRPKNAQPLDTGLSGSLPSNPGSAASQNPSPHPATPGHTSPATIGPSRKGSLATTTSLQHPQSVSPSSIKSLGTQPGTFGMSMGMPPAYPPGYSGNSFTPHPPGLSSIRPPPGMISGPPGLIPPGRAFPPGPPPGFSSMGELYGMVPGPGSHIRQGSGSFDDDLEVLYKVSGWTRRMTWQTSILAAAHF